MEECKYKQAICFLVMYNLSEKQMGIQCSHAQNEYEILFGNTPEYIRWSYNDKTVLMMDGGTSNRTGQNNYNDEIKLGSMEKKFILLNEIGFNVAAFYEPDLNNSTSAIAFLVDERIYNKDLYPDPNIFDLLTEEEAKIPNFVSCLNNKEISERKLNYFANFFNDGKIAWLRIFYSKLKRA